MRGSALASVLALVLVAGCSASAGDPAPEPARPGAEATPGPARPGAPAAPGPAWAGTAGPGPDSAGSAGIGDGYFPLAGNGGYRVRHYDIAVRFDPATERLAGATVVAARASQRLAFFHLDLALRARSVHVDGRPARFDQHGLELVVRPRAAVSAGERFRVRVRYAGVPARRLVGGGTPWVTTRDGAVAVGEPRIAPWWFPSNDHPSDRARFDVAVTAPRGLQVLGNGRLVASRQLPDDRTRWRWRTAAPMATYLAFVAIGRYDIITGRAVRVPYTYAVSELLGDRTSRHARRSLLETAAVTRFLAGSFGRYPFDALGGVVPGGVISGFGYALENQTRPLYDPAFFRAGRSERVVVHEMAHQWFGDAVTLERWRHIWLNEGLAAYAEWMWREHTGGQSAQRTFRETYKTYPAGDPFWDLQIGDPGPAHLFDPAVYLRGAMTAHALRNRVGDRDFFATMRRWVHRNADGVGSTAELRTLVLRVSGERVGPLFRAWLFSADKPARTRTNGVLR